MGILFTSFMVSHGLNVVASVIMIVASLLIYRRTGIRLVLQMTLLFVLWGVTNSLLMFPNFLSNAEIETIALLNIIGSAFAPSLFLLFADRFEGEVSPVKTSVATTVVALAFFLAIVSSAIGDVSIAAEIVILEEEGLKTMRWAEIPSLFLFPAILLTGYWVQKELNLAERHSIDPKQVTQLRRMKVGNILTFFVGPLFGVLGVVLVSSGELVLGTWASEIIGYLIVSFGVIIFGATYLASNEAAFLKPQRLETLLVVHETGVPVLRYDFRPTEIETDVALVSGAITAITAIMGEAFGVSSSIRSIHFEDKELVLDFSENVAFILITDRSSTFLEEALARFAQTFKEKFAPALQLGGGEIPDKEMFIPSIRKAFGLSH